MQRLFHFRFSTRAFSTSNHARMNFPLNGGLIRYDGGLSSNGYPHGLGQFSYIDANGKKVVSGEAEFKNGLLDGYGKIQDSQGAEYIGRFKLDYSHNLISGCKSSFVRPMYDYCTSGVIRGIMTNNWSVGQCQEFYKKAEENKRYYIGRWEDGKLVESIYSHLSIPMISKIMNVQYLTLFCTEKDYMNEIREFFEKEKRCYGYYL